MDLLIKCGKFILALIAGIGGFNIFWAYCIAIEKLEKQISERWLKVYIALTILGVIAMIWLGIINP